MKVNNRTIHFSIAVLAAALSFISLPIQGQTPPLKPGTSANSPSPVSTAPSSASQFANTLSGDWGGERTKLYNDGVNFALSYNSESAGNPVGGVAQGIDYSQQLALGIDTDFQKLACIPGLKAHFLFVSRIGDSLSADKIHNLFEVQENFGSDEAPHARIVYLTLEESLLDDKLDFLVGRTNAGGDFANSPLFGNFMNVSLDYHPNSLPFNGGFNVFPFSLWGGRVAIKPCDQFYFQTGAYQVDPGLDYRTGFNWGIEGSSGAIIPFELGYTPSFGPDKLPGHFKLGGFWDTSTYTDDRIEAANSGAASAGESPGSQSGRGCVYFLADQMVDRTGPGDQQGTVLLSGITLSDPSTSFFDVFAYGGALMRGYIPCRPHDYVGLLAAYGHVNHRISDTQREEDNLGQSAGVQSYETTLELDYGWQATPWLRFTPNLQGILNPGGAHQISDALVVGLKVDAQF